VAIALRPVAGLFGVPGIFWLSNGQTEGQITCLKALMYRRASVKRLCVRMRPLCECEQHQI
jgi:hypothetical protein